jgi:hypothetical protein
MNRALFTSLFCSVACTEIPTDGQELSPQDSHQDTMTLADGSIASQSASDDRGLSAPADLIPAEGHAVAILSDRSGGLTVPSAEQSAQQESAVDLDRYFEGDDYFIKLFSQVAEAAALSDDIIQRLIRLEAQSSCEVDAVIHGKLFIDDNSRGNFKLEVSEAGTGEAIDTLEGRVYAGKSTGIMMTADGTMVAAVTAQELGLESFSWAVISGTGTWTNGVSSKGERFFVTIDQQVVGFETLCE